MDLNNYDILHTFLESDEIDETLAKRCLEIFDEDSKQDVEFVEYFYKFYDLISTRLNDSLFDRIDEINSRYLEIITQDSIKVELYYIKVIYYFHMGFYANSVEHIFKFEELHSGSDSLNIIVSIIMVEILLHDSERNEYIYKYIEKIFNSNAFDFIPNHFRLLACTLALRYNAYLGQIMELKHYYQVADAIIIEEADLENKKLLKGYLDLTTIYINCVLYNKDSKYGISLIRQSNDFQKMFNIFLNGKKYHNDTIEMFMYILESISDLLSKEQLIYYCECFIEKLHLSTVESIAVYSFMEKHSNQVFDKKNYDMNLELKNNLMTFFNRNTSIRNRAIDHELENISFEKEYKEIQKEYNKDALTGCYNRIHLNNQADQFTFFRGYVLFFDLDKLKHINDQYGHHNGDLYIENFSTNLKNVFSMLGDCYRVGGDEFVVIYNSRSKEDVNSNINALIKLCSKPLKMNNLEILTRFSCGIIKVNTETNIDEAVKRADSLMYQAKKDKDVWYYFEEDMR